MPFWAVLDACVLHPVSLADTLLWIAHAEVYQPLWSRDILEELRRSVLERLPDANIDGRIADMIEAFPEAEVSGYEPLAGGAHERSEGSACARSGNRRQGASDPRRDPERLRRLLGG